MIILWKFQVSLLYHSSTTAVNHMGSCDWCRRRPCGSPSLIFWLDISPKVRHFLVRATWAPVWLTERIQFVARAGSVSTNSRSVGTRRRPEHVEFTTFTGGVHVAQLESGSTSPRIRRTHLTYSHVLRMSHDGSQEMLQIFVNSTAPKTLQKR